VVSLLAPAESTGRSELRTVHLSLRAHRDRTLRTWLAAASAATAGPLPATVKIPGTQRSFPRDTLPLASPVEYEPILKTDRTFAVRLATALPALGAMATQLVLTPGMLGIDGGGELVELGVGVVPFPGKGPRRRGAKPLTLTASPALPGLLPGYAAATPVTGHLVVTPRVPGTAGPPDPVGLAALWDAADPVVTVDLGDATVYDVVVSLTFRASVPEVAAR
jgi:hypothetical protein